MVMSLWPRFLAHPVLHEADDDAVIYLESTATAALAK